ncbi:galectin-9-like isoform X2 [Chrysoperla carnea]|uniref:galectin-9-like isoform X2 n=1 Tax=Chrysoperla carnea TaxID=189513 RepID=UPI001D06C648|nr:galectin-9-like isoform X2 [Chrysoperla carnea]
MGWIHNRFPPELPMEIVHSKPLDQPLKTSDVIVIHGTVHNDCERFTINLLSAQSSDPTHNVILHINPRFEQRYIVRNSRIGGKWGAEDTTGKFPFILKRGSEFKLHIFVTDSEFLISIDGEHYCAYPFRIPAKKVTHIEVTGAIQIHDLRIDSLNIYPTSPGDTSTVPILPINHSLEETIKLPFCWRLSGPFVTGQQIAIEGVVKLLPVAFFVNLQNGEHVWPHPEIPLHVNTRFVQKGEMYLVRNSWKNGQWGSEERAVTNKFQPGRPFILSINCEDDLYSIWVNKSLIATYNHQMNRDLATHLYIEGDINVKRIIHSDKILDKYTHGSINDSETIHDNNN